MDKHELEAYFEDLRLAARHVRESTDGFAGEINVHLTSCAAAGDHHQTFDSTTELNDLASLWHGELHGLVEDSHGAGQRYHKSSCNYSEAEHPRVQDA